MDDQNPNAEANTQASDANQEPIMQAEKSRDPNQNEGPILNGCNEPFANEAQSEGHLPIDYSEFRDIKEAEDAVHQNLSAIHVVMELPYGKVAFARAGWSGEGSYIFCPVGVDASAPRQIFCRNLDGSITPYQFTTEDLLAADWHAVGVFKTVG